MGMLYVKVAGQWVPVAPAGTVGPPAYAGPRRDGAAHAQFSHLSAGGGIGFLVDSAGNLFTSHHSGGNLQLWKANASGSPGTQYGVLDSPNSALNGWAIGPHPAASAYQGLWRAGADSLNDYVILSRLQETLINAPTNGTVNTRVGNNDKLQINASQVVVRDAKFWVAYNAGTSTMWDVANIVADASNSNNGRIAIYNASISAFQWRIWPGLVGMDAMDWNCGSFVDLRARSFQVNSTKTAKRAIRPLRVVPETVLPSLDPLSDTVEQPDIMTLRPVVFRPKNEPTHPVSDGNGGWIGEPFEEPLRTEGTRERLGLIAEEVQHVIPSAVSGHTEGTGLSIDYAQITVALLDHVQRLTDEVTALRTRITELEGAS